MNKSTYLAYYCLILIILIVFQYLNKQLYYIFGLLIYTYALTNLFIKLCSLNSS